MPDYTLGDGNKTEADDLLDQMLKAAHTELLTAIATKQAGSDNSVALTAAVAAPPDSQQMFPPTEEQGWSVPEPSAYSNEHLGYVSMSLWREENHRVVRLVEILSDIETLLTYWAEEGWPEALWAEDTSTTLAHIAKDVLRRDVAKRTLLELLSSVTEMVDEELLTAGFSYGPKPAIFGLKLKGFVSEAEEAVCRLFDPSDDTVSCPLS